MPSVSAAGDSSFNTDAMFVEDKPCSQVTSLSSTLQDNSSRINTTEHTQET